MDDKHDPNGSVPIGTFKATTEDGELEIPIEIVDDDEVDTRQLAIQTTGDDALIRRHHDTHDSPDSPRRQRVATLLGVPMPGSGVKAIGRATGGDSFDPTKASRGEISAAVDDALDERPTTIYGYKRDSLSELEKIVETEMTEIPTNDMSETTGELIGVVGDSTDTGTFKIEVLETPRGSMPVLAPAQFVEARARDSKSHHDHHDHQHAKAEPPTRAVPKPEVTARELTKLEVAREREPGQHERSGDEQPTAAIVSRAERTEQEQRRNRAESEPPATQKPISSLAPTEVKRAARPAAKSREPASAIGYGLVAAMVLLGLGGWFFTAGGYRRSTDLAAPPTAAAGVARPRPTDSLASPKLPNAPDVSATPVTPVPEPAPSEQAAPAPAPKPGLRNSADGAPARPRVARKAVRKPAALSPPAPAEAIETPSRDDLLHGLDRIRSNVQACADGRNGVAEVDLTIAANGVVTNALVGGDFGGTPQGSCIARAVRKARFPTFKQDRYRVLFPYVL